MGSCSRRLHIQPQADGLVLMCVCAGVGWGRFRGYQFVNKLSEMSRNGAPDAGAMQPTQRNATHRARARGVRLERTHLCVLSFALTSRRVHVAHSITNALTYTSDAAPLIIHLSSANSGYYPDMYINSQHAMLDLLDTWLSRAQRGSDDGALARALLPALRNQTQRTRIHLNPQRLDVNKHTPGVLAAHLSNFAYCHRARMPCAHADGWKAKFILMGANQLLVRTGLEEWVARYAISYCNGDMCTDLRRASEAKWGTSVHGLEHWQTDLERIGWSHIQHALRSRRRNGSAEVGRDATWLAPFVRLLSLCGKGWVQRRYIRLVEKPPDVVVGLRWWRRALAIDANGTRAAAADTVWASYPHEGSFYPLAVIRKFLADINGSTWALAMGAMGANRVTGGRCPCCHVYPDYRAQQRDSRGRTGGACAFEEFLLPTYARQHYPQLIAHSAPPVVLRLWIDLKKLERLNGTAQLTAFIGALRDRNGHGRMHPHIFGVKVPRHSLPHLSRFVPLPIPEEHARTSSR